MDNLTHINKSFVLGDDISTLYITHLDTYFSKVEELKLNEDFKQLVLLGELALTDKKATFTEVAKIHAQLASSYFYLGEHELCLEHANKCQLISEYLDEPNFLIRSLYLLSAHKRTEANLCSDIEEQRELFQESKSLIHKAIKYFNRCDCDFLKAKVLFNGGAAYSDDTNGDLEVAIRWYQEAADLFLSLEEHNDYYRTLIRLGKVWLLQHKYDDLTELLNKVDALKLPKKTKVHYQYLEAQYYIAIKKYLLANAIIFDALETAIFF
jgi:tetratricopeptide (TPR) repeat protein